MPAGADTIAAIATARGRAALAIVRMSGPDAVGIARKSFRGADLGEVPSHTVHVGYLVTPDGSTIDQVVATVFRAPRSVTGEDVVEFSCHGGDLAPQLVLRTLLDAGARPAQPGEFTQRAFLNGKMDLAQAEAVADVIHAQSSLAHRVSLAHLQGKYSDAIDEVRKELLHTCAMVELELDFVEEDVEFADKDELLRLLNRTESLLKSLLDSYQLGSLLRDGVTVVIGGRPNAGKSTLLNALVGRDRAIVSPVPGTTRDEIEAEGEIEGLLFRFVDTAGLRETTDLIEAEGVRRTHRTIGRADVLIYVYDLAAGLTGEERSFLTETTRKHPELRIIVAGNKADLTDEPAQPAIDGVHSMRISARRGTADASELAELRDRLLDVAGTDLASADVSTIVINQRHRAHIRKAVDAVRSAVQALERGAGGDALALDLRLALHELGGITGEITTEDILGEIFSNFCIGK